MKTLKQIKFTIKDVLDEGEDGLMGFIYSKGERLGFVFSWGGGWEHASISLKNRCPTWEEMCFAKNLFWFPNEWVIQYHPAESDYINNHPYVLHLWKPIGIEFPKPPIIFV